MGSYFAQSHNRGINKLEEKRMKLSYANEIEGVAVCKKDVAGRVLSQNEECLKICGDRKEQVCEDRCMLEYKKENKREAIGSDYFQSVIIDRNEYDILMLNDGERLTTILFDLTRKKSADKEFFRQFDLTPREFQIVELILSKRSNHEIAEQLFISKKTLKTHINHILKKIPREYLPRRA